MGDKLSEEEVKEDMRNCVDGQQVDEILREADIEGTISET